MTMCKGEKEIEQFFKGYFTHNKEIAQNDFSFKGYSDKENQCAIGEKKYSDISYVNYWIDKDGNAVYKVHMKDGESFYVDIYFSKEYCPHGVNVINEVCKREQL